MLYALAGMLLALWILGIATSYTIDGFIHLFLLAAIVVALISLVRESKPRHF